MSAKTAHHCKTCNQLRTISTAWPEIGRGFRRTISRLALQARKSLLKHLPKEFLCRLN